MLDNIYSLPVSWTFMSVGLAMYCVSYGIGSIPILPLMRESSAEKSSELEIPNRVLFDIFSAIYTLVCAAGEVFGAVLGGLMMEVLPKCHQTSCANPDVSKCVSAASWSFMIFGSSCIVSSFLTILLVPTKTNISAGLVHQKAEQPEVHDVSGQSGHHGGILHM